MCGIAFSIGENPEKSLAFAERALQILIHRGPDGEGIYNDQNVAMVHRRLAILDLTEAGAQPMLTPDKRFVIIHNGEVYNHLELRKRFLADYSFKGHSDTETLLVLYAKLGSDMLQYLVGMWAFAIWDSIEQKLFVSRDRYGQKPLYWRRLNSGGFRFASEIKPLLEPGEKNTFNATAVTEYLALGNYGHLGEQTFFKDIEQLLPASYCFITSDTKSIVNIPYWKLPRINENDKVAFSDKVKRDVKDVVCEAVKSQLLSDVTVGATLSGGIDSSVITGIMSQYVSSPFPVFTAQTNGSKWDESEYVKEVENKWGANKIKIHWKELINTRISQNLEKYIEIQEEPFGDPSIMAHGFLMNIAKENGIKVVLGGQGGDELFFGYKNMTNSLLSQGVSHLNFRWVKNNAAGLSKTELARILLGGLIPEGERYLRKKNQIKYRSFIKDTLLDQVVEKDIPMALANQFYQVWNESISGVHLPHLVHYDDRNGMSKSLEGRMPFLDHRIAEAVAGINYSDFFKNGKSKNILREACKEFIPDKILNRKDKQGFFTPIHEMIYEDIDWVSQVIHSDTDLPQLVDINTVNSDLDYYRSGAHDNYISRRIWRTLSFVLWKRRFNISL